MKNPASSDLAQKLFFYGLSAGAASLGAVSSANATIYYSGVLTSNPTFSGNSVSFDLENTASPAANPATGSDFKLNGNGSTNKIVTNGTGARVVAESRDDGNEGSANYILRLNAGETIGSSRPLAYGISYFNTIPVTAFGANPNDLQGDWLPGDRGFVGLTIVLDGTGEAGAGAAGTTVFGWADVTINNFDDSGVGRFTLNGYAYEANGNSIPAGAVPEPSTAALLIAGAAGVAVLRQRRNAARKAS